MSFFGVGQPVAGLLDFFDLGAFVGFADFGHLTFLTLVGPRVRSEQRAGALVNPVVGTITGPGVGPRVGSTVEIGTTAGSGVGALVVTTIGAADGEPEEAVGFACK